MFGIAKLMIRAQEIILPTITFAIIILKISLVL